MQFPFNLLFKGKEKEQFVACMGISLICVLSMFMLVWWPSLHNGVFSILAFFSVSACTSIAVLLAYQHLYAALLVPCITLTGRIMVSGCLWQCVSTCTITHALSCTVFLASLVLCGGQVFQSFPLPPLLYGSLCMFESLLGFGCIMLCSLICY